MSRPAREVSIRQYDATSHKITCDACLAESSWPIYVSYQRSVDLPHERTVYVMKLCPSCASRVGACVKKKGNGAPCSRTPRKAKNRSKR